MFVESTRGILVLVAFVEGNGCIARWLWLEGLFLMHS